MQESSSLFEPLKNRAFLVYCLAGLSGNFGWQIQLVGATWLMMSLGGSPELVALIQTAVALPVMLLSIPGGAISDIVGTRNIVLWSHMVLALLSVMLATFAYFGGLTTTSLLVFTFLIGSGRAVYYPGWQAVVSELLSRRDRTAAIAVNASALNLARSVGPAVGGAIVGTSGAFAAFAFNALTTLSVILVAMRWPKTQPALGLPRESIAAAMVAGLRYVALSPTLVSIAVRGTVFNVAAISIIALMPLVARDLLDGGATVYGFLLGAFGIGAIIGALCLGPARARLSLELCVAFCFLGFAGATILLGYSRTLALSVVASALAGSCWVFIQVSLNSAMQLSSPQWVLSRSNGIYQTCIFGGNAVGGLIWGIVAGSFGTPAGLAASAAMMAAGAAMGIIWRLPKFNDSE